MATASSDSTPGSMPPSYSNWADPRTRHLWQAARDKLADGGPLAPPRMILVVVSTPYASILLVQMASLAKRPKVATVARLSSEERPTGESLSVCSLSEEAVSRLEEHIEHSEELLVNLGGTPRHAYRFRENAQHRDGSDDPSQALQQLQILDRLMHLTERGAEKVGDFFDLIGGVGMSGLLSILFRYPKSTVFNCSSLLEKLPYPLRDLDDLEIYLKKEISKFEDEPQIDDTWEGEDSGPFLGVRRSAVSDSEDNQSDLPDSDGKRSVFDEKKEEVDLNKPFISDIEGQNIFVKANVRNRQEEILLRTYSGDDPQLISENISNIEAIRSTLAAFRSSELSSSSSSPSHHESVYTGPFGLQSLPERQELGWNNPIYDVYRETRSIWPGRDIVIVSIGYDRAPLHRIVGSEELVDRFKMNYPDMGKDNLFRFQPVGGNL
ncbi:MAG: hypothetical protein Q9167_007369, partial [Letrouitia subvulpina]